MPNRWILLTVLLLVSWPASAHAQRRVAMEFPRLHSVAVAGAGDVMGGAASPGLCTGERIAGAAGGAVGGALVGLLLYSVTAGLVSDDRQGRTVAIVGFAAVGAVIGEVRAARRCGA